MEERKEGGRVGGRDEWRNGCSEGWKGKRQEHIQKGGEGREEDRQKGGEGRGEDRQKGGEGRGEDRQKGGEGREEEGKVE